MKDVQKIRAVFCEALEKQTQQARDAYIARACKGDPNLRQEVQALLETQSKANDFFKGPLIGPEIAEDEISEAPGTVIGRYKLLEKIGEGGMAVVYMAEQEKPLHRRVALKIIKLGMDTKQVIARFEVERQALAVMDHPNIAKVLDAGSTETGRPYFVMELVRGVSISKYCDKNKLDTKDRLDLFVQVCNAVQHAHQKGIIHRDIKPSNVMVTLHDGKPVPKVIDFGIAKATSQRLTEKTLFTRYAQMIGTPAYMSPEQAEMSGLDIDTRTDIYSLGILLYELLTGVTPFSEEQLREAGYVEMQRIIREEEPSKPSTKLSTMGEKLTDVAKHRQTKPEALTKLVRGDLDWIVMKSLEKTRTRRYDTTAEFAADIERHLNNEPVHAAAPSIPYKAHKFFRRHRLGVIAGLLVVGALAGGAMIATLGLLQANEALYGERRAVQESKEAQALEASARQEAVRQRDEAQYNEYVAQMRLAPNYWGAGQIMTLKDMLDEYVPQSGHPDFRGWEWYYMLSLCYGDMMTLRAHESPVRSVAWSPDGQRIASASNEIPARVWDASSGEHLLTLEGHSGGVAVAWSPDGKRLVTGCRDRTVVVWDADTGKEIFTLRGHTGVISSVAWNAGGTRIASGGSDNTVKVWDAAAGKEVLTLEGHSAQVYSLAWCPTREHLASGDLAGWVKIWDVQIPEQIATWRPETHDLFTVAWSPDGTRLAMGGYAQPLKVWDPTVGREIASIPHAGGIEEIAWSPDGRHIASATRAQKVRIWDVNTLQEVRTLRGHVGWVNSVAWSPDSRQVVSGGRDNTIKIWDVEADEQTLKTQHANVQKVLWNPKTNTLASAGGGKIKTWDIEDSREIMDLQGGDAIAWSPDGGRLAVSNDDQTIKIWDCGAKRDTVTLGPFKNPVKCITWSCDAKQIAVNQGTMVGVWDVEAGRTAFLLYGDWCGVWVVAWAPNGRRLASAGWDGVIKVWDVETRKNLLTLRGHTPQRYIESIAWDPDGNRLVSGGWDQLVKVWDVDIGREVLSLRGHTALINAVAWSPDGGRIASSSSDATIKIWDSLTGQELLTLTGDKGRYRSVTWSPDGRRLGAACADGTVRVWDASEGYEIVSSPLYSQERAQRWSREGSSLIRSERYADACKAFAKAIELDLNSSKLHFSLGQAQSLAGQHEKAMMHFVRTIELDPNCTVAWNLLGLTPSDLKDLDAARVRTIAPNPFNGGSCTVSPDTKLYWVPAKDAISYKVYFGTDPAQLSLLGEIEEGNCIRAPELERLRWYCWRVDSVKADKSVTRGDVWTFSTGTMVGWWKFDQIEGNVILDSSGSNNNGIIVGDAHIVSDDQRGRVLSLDGDGDYVTIPRVADSVELTYALWVNQHVVDNVLRGLVTHEHWEYGSVHLNLRDGRPKAGINAAIEPRGDLDAVDYTLAVGEWHHVALTKSPVLFALYVDGELAAQRELTVSDTVILGEGFIGAWVNVVWGATRYFNGLIDDVRIYSYALSEVEVKELCAGRGPGPNERPE